MPVNNLAAAPNVFGPGSGPGPSFAVYMQQQQFAMQQRPFGMQQLGSFSAPAPSPWAAATPMTPVFSQPQQFAPPKPFPLPPASPLPSAFSSSAGFTFLGGSPHSDIHITEGGLRVEVPQSSCHGGHGVKGNVCFESGVHKWSITILSKGAKVGIGPEGSSFDTYPNSDPFITASVLSNGQPETNFQAGTTVFLELDLPAREFRWSLISSGLRGSAPLPSSLVSWYPFVALQHGASIRLSALSPSAVCSFCGLGSKSCSREWTRIGTAGPSQCPGSGAVPDRPPLPESCAALRQSQRGANTCVACSGRFEVCHGSYGTRELSGNWSPGSSSDVSRLPESPNATWCCAECQALAPGGTGDAGGGKVARIYHPAFDDVLQYCKALCDQRPRHLLTKDGNGLTPLDRARDADEGVDVVLFLGEKTDTVSTVEAEFPGLSDDDFKERFICWEMI